MRTMIVTILLLATCVLASETRSKVVVLPFDRLMSETYDIFGDKTETLEYQAALHSFIIGELAQHPELLVVTASEVSAQLGKVEKFEDESLALKVAESLEADFVVIGSFAELPTGIRSDTRIVDRVRKSVPRGFVAGASVHGWGDLSQLAQALSAELYARISTAISARQPSLSNLVLEGPVDQMGYRNPPPPGAARLIIMCSVPTAKITSLEGDKFKRCDLTERSSGNSSDDFPLCKSADIPEGFVTVQIEARMHKPFSESLELKAGQVYRLNVDLAKVEMP